MPKNNYIVYDWLEVRDATDSLYKRLFNVKIDNFVKDVCSNGLPHAMTSVLAAAFVHGLIKEDADVDKVINAYLQLEDVGFIGVKE